MNNDFAEIQKIYEGYRGQSIDFGPNSNAQYSPADASANLTYGKGRLPNAYPGMGGQYSAWEYGQAGQNITAPADSDEEVPVKDIKNHHVLDKIDDHMKQAHQDEMMYAVHSLGQLKEYIKSL